MNTIFNADQSAAILTGKLRQREPFVFLRYGDGAIECIFGLGRGGTCDGERYTAELGAALCKAWNAVIHAPNVYVGDWLSASFDGDRSSEYAFEYAALIGDARPHWLHFETLLLMRESQALVEFYKTVALDPRRKVFLGPAENADAARMLGARHVVAPMRELFAAADSLTRQLEAEDFEILLWGAGMAGSIPAVRLWQQFPERTYINLGSAMDPLFRGPSRRQQLPPARARALFRELL